MPVDATVQLERLHCVQQFDEYGNSEPYLWTVLVSVDDISFIQVTAPDRLQGGRQIVRGNIKAGDAASPPIGQRTFRHRFEDGSNTRAIGLIVAFFERDASPEKAVLASYDAFVHELPLALTAFALAHNLQGPKNQAEIDEIADMVRPKVRAAFIAALSRLQKIQAWLGNLHVDDELGFANFFEQITDPGRQDRAFWLEVEKHYPSGAANHYRLDCRLELHDSCQDQVDAVEQAGADVIRWNFFITDLQSRLATAGRTEKQEILKRIRSIQGNELPAARAELQAAREALVRCRSGGGSSGLPTANRSKLGRRQGRIR